MPDLVTHDLAPVLRLLPSTVSVVRDLGGPHRPCLLRFGSKEAVLRRNDVGRLALLGLTPDDGLASIRWLHGFLSDLRAAGFAAPVPMAELNGESIALVDGAIYELLSFLPGAPIGWADASMLFSCGRLLARFHRASVGMPPRPQRPGALVLTACRPAHPDALVDEFAGELESVGYAAEARGVVHGDATNINVVDDRGALRLVDFALAYEEALLFDIASALWRNGRASADAVTYDPTRVAHFVRGYASERALPEVCAKAIVVYMKGRGMQLLHRLELRRGIDDTVIRRLQAIRTQQGELRDAIVSALSSA